MSIRPLSEFPAARRAAIGFVLFDIDDTLTTDGRLSAAAYAALEDLSRRGLRVIPVTGRPAGWCDLIARFWLSAGERDAARRRLDRLAEEILAAVPGARLAADQPYRVADLAIDFAEDTGPLPSAEIDRIVALMHAPGAMAKVSSIHVNGWFGDWDKLAMTRRLFREIYGIDLDQERDTVAFIGDSPNDEPMFAYFPLSVGVANVRPFLPRMRSLPAYVTEAAAGDGFVEFAAILLS